MVAFSSSADVQAVFCFGAAICDVEWVINEDRKLPGDKISEVRDCIYGIAFSDKFNDIAGVNNIIVKKWKFEDCDQILLAHQDLYIETDDVEFYSDIFATDEEQEDIMEVISQLEDLIENQTGVSIDFKVQPQFMVHLYYE